MSRIEGHEVRVIGPSGEDLGVFPAEQALRMAQEESTDLVEVDPSTNPPTCRMMEYGRFRFFERKKRSASKRKRVVPKLKDVKLRPVTEKHDYEVKTRKVREVLGDGNKARVIVVFRAREMTHRERGQKVLRRVIEDLRGIAVVESAPRTEGRRIFMILAPAPTLRRPPGGAATPKLMVVRSNPR